MNVISHDGLRIHVSQRREEFLAEVAHDRLADQARGRRPAAEPRDLPRLLTPSRRLAGLRQALVRQRG
jgi:hypothetical protein